MLAGQRLREGQGELFRFRLLPLGRHAFALNFRGAWDCHNALPVALVFGTGLISPDDGVTQPAAATASTAKSESWLT